MKISSALWCYFVAGWSGFYVMVVELLSARLLAPYVGSAIHVWGSVIFVFMLGLAIGYLLGGLYSRKDPSLRRLFVILAVAALSTIPTFTFGEVGVDWITYHLTDPRMGSLASCVMLFFVPAVFCGMVSPYAIRLLVSDRESSGHKAGYLYFISTVGSSAGTLMTSFFFVVWAEVNTILISAMCVSLALAALGFVAAPKKEATA
jgi:hypothetical protein